jgi:hypothetical protein
MQVEWLPMESDHPMLLQRASWPKMNMTRRPAHGRDVGAWEANRLARRPYMQALKDLRN